LTPREEVLGIIRERQGYENVLVVPRAFIELTGDQSAALLLSQLLYWTDRATVPGGWVYKSHAEWKEELGMGRSTVDRARRTLAELGLLHQACRQAHGRRTMFFRIDLPALRTALMSQTATLKSVRPERRLATGPGEGCRQTHVSSFDTPETETTAQTTSETPAETTASSSSTRAKGKGNERNGESGSGAPDDLGKHHGASPGRHGSLPQQEDAASAPGRHGSVPLPEDAASAPGVRASLPLQEDAASAPAEDRLFDVLERVSGFPRDRDRARLREQLADYPGVDYLLEVKKFAAFYEKRVLDRPWFALLTWLDKASMRAAHGLSPAPSVGKPPPAGASHPAPTARQTAEPLPLGVTTAGPAYRKMMQRRQSENQAPP
jgi:hypothetical protein